MNKLYTTLLIACLAAGFTACNDDDCEDLHLGNLAHYPNVLKELSRQKAKCWN